MRLARLADIGAGTGRDAAWFACQGHKVIAVEPAPAMRDIARAWHPDFSIHWLDDRLPELSRLREFGDQDLLILNGVWHHLDVNERRRSLAALSAILAHDGLTLLRFRHGPTAQGRPGFQLSLTDTIDNAVQIGMRVLAKRPVPALLATNRAAGVTWTWLALGKA